MIDPHGRNVTYLRLSVTDRCNFRCRYCMPEEGVEYLPRKDILTYEEIMRIVSLFVSLGISKIRITGGEPLVRKDVVELAASIGALDGLKDLSMSTNGMLLERHAEKLKRAGVQRLNISLDTMKPDRFKEITLRDDLDRVLSGIKVAEEHGFHPIKLNMVVMKGINDDELADFAALTFEKDYIVRFIEMMPLKEGLEAQAKGYLSTEAMKERISHLGELEPFNDGNGETPARYFKLPGGKGKIGFISPLSETFCAGCNRIRLTATGGLKLCLFNEPEVDFRMALRSGASDEDLRQMVEEALKVKPLEHKLKVGKAGFKNYTAMSQIGG